MCGARRCWEINACAATSDLHASRRAGAASTRAGAWEGCDTAGVLTYRNDLEILISVAFTDVSMFTCAKENDPGSKDSTE